MVNNWIVNGQYKILSQRFANGYKFEPMIIYSWDVLVINHYNQIIASGWGLFHTLVPVKTMVTSSTAQGGGGSFKNRKPIGDVGCCESRMAERIH